MKKILTLTILVLLSVTARAQYIDGVPQSLERRAGHLYTDDGTRLSQAAAMSLLSEKTSVQGRRHRKQHRRRSGSHRHNYIRAVPRQSAPPLQQLGTLLNRSLFCLCFRSSRRSIAADQHPALLHSQCPAQKSSGRILSPDGIRPAAVPWGAAKRHRAGHTVLTHAYGAGDITRDRLYEIPHTRHNLPVSGIPPGNCRRNRMQKQ